MSNGQILFLILGIIAVVIIALAVVLPELKKRGVNLDAILTQTQKAVETATTAMTLIKPFVADVKGVDVVDKILTTAAAGVGNAEQLYKIGELKGDERNKAAKQYVYDSLKLTGVEVTSDIERLVTGAVEASVNALGHAPAPEPTSTAEIGAAPATI
ncbi:MAG: hypothetical protein LBN00_06160 [Oscillospiraceae bacterium]|jgi:hypothetical protein|nr:hypothetical protein [Oscillospiraceae bacterium]